LAKGILLYLKKVSFHNLAAPTLFKDLEISGLKEFKISWEVDF
jgi:hypothetical protein